MKNFFSRKGKFWYLGGFAVLTIMIMELMLNGVRIPSNVNNVQLYHSFKYLHKISKSNDVNKTSLNINDLSISMYLEENLKTIYHPGENIPVSKTIEMHKLSHKILKRRLSPEEYNNYKELLFGVIDIFNENNIRYGTYLKIYFS